MAKQSHQRISFIYYKDADTEKRHRILLDVSKDHNNEVTLRIGVSRIGTDRMYSNYMFEAGKTQDEVKEWLENTEICVPIIMDTAKKLSHKDDE